MHIEQIKIENFRLLQNCCLDMREKTTLLVGKNNTGKTSFAVLLERFLEKPDHFTYTDFPIPIRKKLLGIDSETNIEELAIRLSIADKGNASACVLILLHHRLNTRKG